MVKLLAILFCCASSLWANQPPLDALSWRHDYDRWPWVTSWDLPEGGNAFSWTYDEPTQTWGEVHYVICQFTPDFVPGGIVMTFRVESSPDVEYVSVEVPEIPAQVRLIFMATGSAGCSPVHDNDPTNPIPCQYRSWWVQATSYRLGSAENKTMTFDVPILPELWSSVYGVRGDNSGGWFDVARRSMRAVGFTFGGNFYGHGVRLNAGSATFNLLDYRLLPDEAGML